MHKTIMGITMTLANVSKFIAINPNGNTPKASGTDGFIDTQDIRTFRFRIPHFKRF